MSDSPQQRWNETYKKRGMVAVVDFAKNAVEAFRSQPGCTVLDIGCGDGRDAAFFAKHGFDVTAIDFSEEAIRRVRAAHPDIRASVMDITAMDFPDASFDAIYAHLSLHYFDDATTESVFANVRRMLKPGGLFFVRCKSVSDPLYGHGEKVGDDMFRLEHVRHFFSVDYMRKKLRDFTILSLEETSSAYDGKQSCFVDAAAQRPT